MVKNDDDKKVVIKSKPERVVIVSEKVGIDVLNDTMKQDLKELENEINKAEIPYQQKVKMADLASRLRQSAMAFGMYQGTEETIKMYKKKEQRLIFDSKNLN